MAGTGLYRQCASFYKFCTVAAKWTLLLDWPPWIILRTAISRYKPTLTQPGRHRITPRNNACHPSSTQGGDDQPSIVTVRSPATFTKPRKPFILAHPWAPSRCKARIAPVRQNILHPYRPFVRLDSPRLDLQQSFYSYYTRCDTFGVYVS